MFGRRGKEGRYTLKPDPSDAVIVTAQEGARDPCTQTDSSVVTGLIVTPIVHESFDHGG